MRGFLNEVKQRVIHDGQSPIYKNVKVGVLQGSILDTSLFLIYVNDLAEGFLSNVMLFADDTSLFFYYT